MQEVLRLARCGCRLVGSTYAENDADKQLVIKPQWELFIRRRAQRGGAAAIFLYSPDYLKEN